MGTAGYYVKMNNGNKETMEKIRLFFLEGCEAEEYWQNNRDMNEGKQVSFWMPFKKQFPTVSKYLKFINLLDKDCNNDLAGNLDFGSYQDIQDNFQLKDNGEIWYYAEVWHFADWNVLIKFLEHEYGVTNARWISDEYIEPFDLL
jgi:hypothetical protein